MSALDELRWRDEILQALFWMRGEGLAGRVTPSELARFLAADEAGIGTELERLAAERYVRRVGSRQYAVGSAERASDPSSTAYCLLPTAYCLTPLGIQEGGRRFRDEFAGLTQQAHGECGPGCWCHNPEREGEPCPNQPDPEPERARA